MSSKLLLSKKFERVISNLDYTQNTLQDNGLISEDSILNLLIINLENNIENIIIDKLEFVDLPIGYDKAVTYGGSLVDNENNLISYVFTTTIDKDSRSAFISQQIGGTISDIILKNINDTSVMLTSIPIYLLDIDVTPFTDQKYFFVECSWEYNVNVINVFNRDYNNHEKNLGLSSEAITIKKHDTIIKTLDKKNLNNYYELDNSSKELLLLPNRLKKDSMTNEVYYYSHRVLAAIVLAKKENYKIILKDFEEYFTSKNKNVKALIEFSKKMNKDIDMCDENIVVNESRHKQIFNTNIFNVNRRRRKFILDAKDEGKEYEDYKVNPAKIRDASAKHELLIDKTAEMLTKKVGLPLFESKVDLFYIDGNKKAIFIYEMKTITSKNWKKQIRTAIGQLIEYEYFNFMVDYPGFQINKFLVVNKKINSNVWNKWEKFLKDLDIQILFINL